MRFWKQLFALALLCAAAFAVEDVEPYWMHDVTFDQLLAGERLADGDVIQLVVEENFCIPNDNVAVTVELISPISWWKGFRLHTFADSGYYKVVSEVQESQVPMTTFFDSTDLLTNHAVLWKAKTFGAHTAVYRISDARDRMTGGKKYSFFWIAD